MEKIKLIIELQEWSKKYNEIPTRDKFKQKYKINKYFGTWNNALKEAGLYNKSPKINKKNIIKKIKDFHKLHNRPPKQKELPDIRHIGKLNNLIQEAGLKISFPRKDAVKSKLSDNELLELIKAAIISGKAKNAEEFYKLSNIPSRSLVYKKFGSFNNICILLDLKDKIYTRSVVIKNNKELLNDYIRLSKILNKPNGATSSDLNKSHLTYNSNVYSNRFGGINEVRKLLGFQVQYEKPLKYTKNEIIKILRTTGKVSAKKLDTDKMLPSSGSVLRAFKTTKLSDVWKELKLIKE